MRLSPPNHAPHAPDEPWPTQTLGTRPLVSQDGSGSDRWVMAIGLIAALAVGLWTFQSLAQSRESAPEPTAPAPVVSPTVDEPPPEIQVAVQEPPSLPRDRALSPSLVYDVTTAPALAAPAVATTDAPAVNNTAVAQTATMTAEEKFAARVGSQTRAVSYASTTTSRLDTLIPEGTLIPAIMETAINSDLPGYVRAVVSDDVSGFDGSRVLIPRGSRLIGQYRSGISVGQTRAHIVWTRLLTPGGVSVDLLSPAVDQSGQTGLAGEVNTHFFKRFGSAILMTLVGGISAAAGDSADVVIGASQGAQSAAAIALQQDMQIPPTIRIASGEPVRVITARDLDFSLTEALTL